MEKTKKVFATNSLRENETVAKKVETLNGAIPVDMLTDALNVIHGLPVTG